MLIVIIDAGMPEGVTLDYDGKLVPVTQIRNEDIGHGHILSTILKKGCGDFAEIVQVSVGDISQGVNEGELIEVLNKVKAYFKPDIINLSLGFTVCEEKERLRKVCNELSSTGTIIVSAFDNAGGISYPAALGDVIGVVCGENCRKIDDFEYFDDDIVNIGAKGDAQRVSLGGTTYALLSGTSLACAHVTVQCAKFLRSGIASKKGVMEAFKKIAIKCYDKLESIPKTQVPFQIHKAVFFPFNKEMHSIARFYRQIQFSIMGFYDTKYSGRVGASIQKLLKDDNAYEDTIHNISDLDWTESFDTIVIGHVLRLQSKLDKDYFELIYRKAQEYNKNIYAFDDLSSIYPQSNSVFYPRIDRYDLPPNRLGRLYKISKPVLGIFGTSSKQGKFSLQLLLYDRLSRLGYKVGRIGTEASSLLFGMEYVYPMGYNSSVYLQEAEAVLYLNDIIHHLDEENYDLIMVGSQSGTVEFDYGNIAMYDFAQKSFLIGTLPDVVVLCVNPFDDDEYVLRTIQYIESSTNCIVIALVVFPMTIDDRWNSIYQAQRKMTLEEQQKTAEHYSRISNKPTYRLDCFSDIDLLVECIIAALT